MNVCSNLPLVSFALKMECTLLLLYKLYISLAIHNMVIFISSLKLILLELFD